MKDYDMFSQVWTDVIASYLTLAQNIHSHTPSPSYIYPHTHTVPHTKHTRLLYTEAHFEARAKLSIFCVVFYV